MSQSQEFARQVIEAEVRAARAVVGAVDASFDDVVAVVLGLKGSVICSGVGKAGIIARKVSATLSSTGTLSHCLDVADALHGDLGSVRAEDLIILFSFSGESDEVVRLVPFLRQIGSRIVAITSRRESTLARLSDWTLALGPIEEACPLRLAPSATTTAMLVLGDALALTLMQMRGFGPADFARYHPAGQLGRQLLRVSQAMGFRRGENLPVASDRLTVGQVLEQVSHIKRRSGAVVLVNDQGLLSGIFSDADLRRLLTQHREAIMDAPVAKAMTPNPKRVAGDAPVGEALELMRRHRIDELPVVDPAGAPIGLIDVQDLVALRMVDAGDLTR